MFYGYVGKSTNLAASEELSFALRHQILGLSYAQAIQTPKMLICRRPNTETEFESVAQRLWHPKMTRYIDGIKEALEHFNWNGLGAGVAGYKSTVCLMKGGQGNQLYVVDMRPLLGQIWFMPTAEMWRRAVDMTKAIRMPDDQVIIEFPDSQIWWLQAKHSEWNIRKFKITQERYLEFPDGTKRPLPSVDREEPLDLEQLRREVGDVRPARFNAEGAFTQN
jgi:hypothetical protein